MLITIYGRSGCSYCTKAVALAKQLSEKGTADYEYIDIRSVGIDGEMLSKIIGKPVKTVPQIKVDDNAIGGYSALSALVSTL